MGLTQQPTKIWEIPEPVPAYAPTTEEPQPIEEPIATPVEEPAEVPV